MKYLSIYKNIHVERENRILIKKLEKRIYYTFSVHIIAEWITYVLFKETRWCDILVKDMHLIPAMGKMKCDNKYLSLRILHVWCSKMLEMDPDRVLK